MRRLIGKTDMEDALKRLDKLTQEEARMASAENLKATHAVDERVRGVANTAITIDNRVAGVDTRVANVNDNVVGVDDRVARVDDRVAGVDDKVAIVNDKVAAVDNRVANVDDRLKVVGDNVAEVIHGAQIIFCQSSESKLTDELFRRKGNEHSHATGSQRSRSNQTFVML
jgi:chromosome segregation ATPase